MQYTLDLIRQQLYTAVVSDVLDAEGWRDQAEVRYTDEERDGAGC